MFTESKINILTMITINTQPQFNLLLYTMHVNSRQHWYVSCGVASMQTQLIIVIDCNIFLKLIF